MLHRNDLFTDHRDGSVRRLLHADESRNLAVTIDVEDDAALPQIDSFAELSAADAKFNVRTQTESLQPLTMERASTKAQKRANDAWTRIEPLVKNPDIYHRHSRYPLIQARAQEVGCSENTLLKDLRRYWRGGQTRNALLGYFHMIGKLGLDGSRSGGRRPTLSDYAVYRIAASDVANMHEAIKTVYLGGGPDNLTKATASDAYDKMLTAHYSYVDGNGKKIIRPKGERPTIRQFYSFLHKNYSFQAIKSNRLSDAEYEREYAAKLGTVIADSLGPGHQYEIDASIADNYVVAKHDRSRIIGKPTVYLVVDRYTRLVVGFYVGLENASWTAAMLAVLSISENKAALCARYNVDYSADDWPADGLFPSVFIADRGPEMMGKNSNLIVSGLEVTVVNLPTQRPDHKPIVECSFKMLHQAIAATSPGYTPPANAKKRQGKKYDKDASLTLDEFISIYLKAIIIHNRAAMPNYQMPIALVSKGLAATPINIWNEKVTRTMGQLSRLSEQHVRFSLLPKKTATVTQGGLFFRGCYYEADIATEQNWFARAAQGTWAVDVSYDERLVDTIYIHDSKDRTQYHLATLLDSKSGEYRGRSFNEVDAYELLKKKMQPEYEQMHRQSRADFNSHAEPIAKAARTAREKAARGVSRRARTVDTAENRDAERRARRQAEAVLSTPVPKPAPIAYTPITPVATPTIDSDVQTNLPRQLSLGERLRLKRQEMQNAR